MNKMMLPKGPLREKARVYWENLINTMPESYKRKFLGLPEWIIDADDDSFFSSTNIFLAFGGDELDDDDRPII